MRKAGWGAMLFLFACSAHGDGDVDVRVGPTLLFPKGILDSVTTLTLRAYDSSVVTCDADRGLPDGDTSALFLEEALGTDGCAGGARFCGDVTLARSTTPFVFVASAEDASGRLIATGCESLLVDEPRVSLTIQMHRYLEPATCGNGTLEPTELCDPPRAPDDSVCDDACQTKEVWLSNGRGTPTGTVSGKPGDKERPALVWPAGKGPNAKLLALFTDKSPNTREITLRVRSDAFGRFSSQGSEVADFSFFLPTDPKASIPPAESPANQSAPAAIALSDRTWVAFEDDTDGDLDIRLRSMDATLTAEQSSGAIRVNGNGTASEGGSQSLPSIAASAQGILFVAWQDERDGSVQGRTYTPADGTRGATRVLGTAGANKNVRVTGLGSGFVAVWESGSDVKLARLSPDGTPSPEEKVNADAHTGPVSHPDVAALADGRFAVVFSDRGDIFVQRYGADGQAIAGDQDTPVNGLVTSGDQHGPVVASIPSGDGAYAVAWLDGASGDVRAAFLGGTSSFLFNPVDGQPTEFVASSAPGRLRSNPAIAVGGAGPYLAIAWEDTTRDAKAGIYGRRLPLPQ
jgi:hypothetical protein